MPRTPSPRHRSQVCLGVMLLLVGAIGATAAVLLGAIGPLVTHALAIALGVLILWRGVGIAYQEGRDHETRLHLAQARARHSSPHETDGHEDHVRRGVASSSASG